MPGICSLCMALVGVLNHWTFWAGLGRFTTSVDLSAHALSQWTWLGWLFLYFCNIFYNWEGLASQNCLATCRSCLGHYPSTVAAHWVWSQLNLMDFPDSKTILRGGVGPMCTSSPLHLQPGSISALGGRTSATSATSAECSLFGDLSDTCVIHTCIMRERVCRGGWFTI